MSPLGFILVITGIALFLMRRHRFVAGVAAIAVATLFLHGLVVLAPLVLVFAVAVLVLVDVVRVGRRHPLLVFAAGLYGARRRGATRARRRPRQQAAQRRQREHRVPCWLCGATITPAGAHPRTMTGNISGLCDRHEVQQPRGRLTQSGQPERYNESDVHDLDRD